MQFNRMYLHLYLFISLRLLNLFCRSVFTHCFNLTLIQYLLFVVRQNNGLLSYFSSLSDFFLSLGMNLNKRELNEHVEFESQTYYAAFAAELEACAQPMWGLLTHCKVKVTS